MRKRLISLMALVLVVGWLGTSEAAYDTVGVYDPDDDPYHNQVDQSGTYSSHTGEAGPENVINLATFQALIGAAFNANAGGVVNMENANGSLDGQDIIAKFGAGKTKSITFSSIGGTIDIGSTIKQGRTPISGRQRAAKTDVLSFEFAISSITGGKAGEGVTYVGGTLLGRDGANLAPIVTATFSGGGTVTAVANMPGKLGIEEDTFFGFVAPPGQSIVHVKFDPTGNATNLEDLAFITSAFVVVSHGASSPKPPNGQADVPGDTSLSWAPGAFAQTHDVYFGTVLADVNAASRTNPKGVLVSQGQDAATYDPPGALAFGQTYYWRIDEVNAPPSNVIVKGSVWSFTVEPYAYPIQNVTATASSAQPGMGPEKTSNGSGLNALDQHSVEPNDMWLSAGSQPNWIQYQFDQIYELSEMQVWNSNQLIESVLGFGAKSVKVEYSVDGITWTELPNVPEFARATGLPAYTANTLVKFGPVAAQYVKLTINSTWGGSSRTGLSEVRFRYLPVQAREPQPAVGATGVALDATLNWRPGREAASHQVYLGPDQQAVTNGTAAAQTVSDHRFAPPALQLGTTYYWRVDEVNAAAATKSWAGAVWSFTTMAYLVVDDFESYDEDNHRLYDTWIDGATDGKNGSFVGHDPSQAELNVGTGHFAETVIVHGGVQSMPVAYDNTSKFSFSEVTRTFAVPQDWTAGGIKSLSLYFRGVATNTGGQLYVKINSAKVPYRGSASDLTKTAWIAWNTDLSAVGAGLNKVTTLTIGVEGPGSKGLLYLDDFCLYPKNP